MDFSRSSWATPSSSGVSAAALAAPLSCRLARRALLLKGEDDGDDGRRQKKRSLRFLAAVPSALPSRNCDEPPIADASFSFLDTIPVDEKAREAEKDGRKTTNQSLFAVAAAALVAASSSPLSPFFPPPASASAGGDALITFNKRAEAAADAVAGALLGALPKGRSSSFPSSSSSSSSSSSTAAAATTAAREEAAEKEAAAAAALLKEVRDVVALNYLDTRSGTSSSNDDDDDSRNGNFDLAAWDAAVEAELAGGGGKSGGGLFFGAAKSKSSQPREQKLRDVPAARRAARRLLAFQLSDPYSRFLSPEEFAAMARYDITGVGLNLGSADEYERKVGERPPGATSSFPSSSSPSSSSSPPPAAQQNDAPGVWVIGVIRGSPADAAGVKQGDRVVAVDAKNIDFSKESAFDVASRIQGAGVAEASAASKEKEKEKERGGGSAAGEEASKRPPLTNSSNKKLFSSFPLLSSSSSSSKPTTRKLSLDVLRRSDGSRARLDLEAPVAPAAVSPVSFKLVEGGQEGGGKEDSQKIGIIELGSFNARARSDSAAAVSELLAKGATSFVLDLRGNRGGLVSEGAEVAALFLEKGSTVATTLGRAPLLLDGDESASSSSAASSSPVTTKTTTRTLSTTAPPLVPPSSGMRLTVLVDERTASAGEIVAGALRDNCRAPLVAVVASSSPSSPGGNPVAAKRTYGKGLIQSVYELGDGSGVVLTVGKYFTPGGVDLDREGLVPDLAVAASGSSPSKSGVPRREEAEAVLDACLRGRGGGSGGG